MVGRLRQGSSPSFEISQLSRTFDLFRSQIGQLSSSSLQLATDPAIVWTSASGGG